MSVAASGTGWCMKESTPAFTTRTKFRGKLDMVRPAGPSRSFVVCDNERAHICAGMTGKVFEVLHRQTRERYALKCTLWCLLWPLIKLASPLNSTTSGMEVRRFDSELLDDLRNEIALLKLVRFSPSLAS